MEAYLMRLKKISIISCVFILLTGITLIIAYSYIGPGADDVKACKEFVDKLKYAKAIDVSENINNIKYKRDNKVVNESDLVEKSMVTQNFALDLDKNNNVIGFIKQDIPKSNVTKVNINVAEELSKKYLNAIYGSNIILKSCEYNEDENYLPYYSFIYAREKDGYLFYSDEIKLNINKENGLLDGYSNSTLQKECKEEKINITKNEAEEQAVKFFLKYNTSCDIEGESQLVFGDNISDKNTSTFCELSYLVILKGKDINDKDVIWKVFVSANNGKVINSLKDGSEKGVEAQ